MKIYRGLARGGQIGNGLNTNYFALLLFQQHTQPTEWGLCWLKMGGCAIFIFFSNTLLCKYIHVFCFL